MSATQPADLGVMTRIEGVLAALGPVAGLAIVDIGCGEGAVARALAEKGARVSGFDPFIEPTGWTAQGAGAFRLGRAAADAIPEPDGSADLVLFVFSLHHVPQPKLAGALAEARRLLRPDGRLCVAEPLAEGPSQYVMEVYHDETEVRRNAAEALARHAAPRFAGEQVLRFRELRVHRDFESYAAGPLAGRRFNGYSEAQVLSAETRRRFAEMLAVTGGRFEQPVRVNLFR